MPDAGILRSARVGGPSLAHTRSGIRQRNVAIERIPQTRYQRSRWKNDMGWTTELAQLPRPDAEGDFDWRVSIAEVDSDCAFSSFPGIDRSLMLLDGDGIEMSGEDFPTQTLRARGQVARFRGEQSLHCRVIGAPSRDFNAMTRRDAYRHELWLRPLVGTMMLFAEARTFWFLYVLGGRVQIAQGEDLERLNTADSALIRFGPAEQSRCMLSGGGELALVKVEAVSQADAAG